MASVASGGLLLAAMLASLFGGSSRNEIPRNFAAGVTPALSDLLWTDVTVTDGRADFTIASQACEETLVLISAIAPPQTTTSVRLNVRTVSTAPQQTSLVWSSESLVPSPPSAGAQSSHHAPRDDSHPIARESVDKRSASPHAEREGYIALTRIIHWPVQCDGRSPFHTHAVRSRELCRGARVCVVWDEDAIDERSAEFAHTLVELLEQSVLHGVESAVGPCADVDGDGRLTVAVSPRMQAFSTGQADLFAFVRAADFRPDGETPWSNRADLIYLAPHIDPQMLPAILTHELTHVAQFSCLLREFDTAPWPLPEWLLEGHAHAVEVRLTGSTHNLTSRWEAFRSHPESSPLVMSDAAAIGRWRDPGSRGATAAFCLWLSRRYGTGWWQRLNDLLIGDDESWQREFGVPFAELYRQWTIDLAVAPASGLPVAEAASFGCLPKLAASATTVRNPNDLQLRPSRVPLPSNGETEVSLFGTATAYCVLPNDGTAPLHVDIQSDASSAMQITIVRRPASASGGMLPALGEHVPFDGRPACPKLQAWHPLAD